MRVAYTTEAIADLDGIFDYIANHYPTISDAFQNRLHAVIARVPDGQRAHRKFPSGREFVSHR
jgi:plasmid stabilization system protein ParE